MKDNKPSPYIELLQKILSGMAKVRMDAGAWLDSESEELERESQAFKIGECLRPFYLAARNAPEQFEQLPLSRETLLKDTDYFFKSLEKEGFFPSPYSPIPGAVDQYTDFAAFTLEFCSLVHDFWQEGSSRGSRLVGLSKDWAKRALDFLLTPDYSLTDENGCRWGGTSKVTRTKKTKEFYTNTYFSSVAVLAINGSFERPVLDLSTERQDELRHIINQAGKWIADRFDGQFITGDEAKTNRQLLHTTWGLRALVETYELQDKSIRKRLPSIANAYLDALRGRNEFTFEQEYLTILSEEVDAPLYYEDRSGLGGILLTLVCLRDISDLERLLDEASYPLLLERVINSLMTLRNPLTGLWYNQQLILSIHSYLSEAFLSLDRRGKGFGSRVEVSGYMIRTAVRETFADETIVNSLQQAVYDRLLRLVTTFEREHAVKDGMSKLLAPSTESNGRDNKLSRRKQSRPRPSNKSKSQR